ncbi:fimbrial biogenesis chaperone [Kushneria phyllosphaerae]|uniref:Pili assembly chaperone N-terminal domain-containing protein n=1 Tax=Kushneria phyllosphaerae TaxID=2100822 RepID=A0A2R8CJ53_9GAMM|nr:molecular chaperone [Kushneria phyllosphaerae]SPJ32929.1 hypothetical protein KSP9073_00931 [Kushneria phyllosphaerae]
MRKILLRFLTTIVLSTLLLPVPAVLAASSILIWPINPTLSSQERARPLWLENQANVPATLQIRILRWQQVQQRNDYQPQDDILPSPPVVTIAPGKRQLVRLTLTGAAPTSGEQAYRILVDEIPDARQQAREASDSRVQFRMRYSVPLFVTSSEVPEQSAHIAEALRWSVITENGQRYLRVHNPGSAHARLARVQMDGTTVAEGLLGYVLAGTTKQWPLPNNMNAGRSLTATVNGADPVKLHYAGS